MSLAHLAQNMAAQGRNGDTMLMHVTPNEVKQLQRAAESQGKSLTINPQTGLPEANIFDDVVDTVKDVATSPLGSLVIGAGLASFGIPPAMAGLYTGLGTAALTGDLKQGLFAGMGAYGGAGMFGGLAGLGESEIADQALNSSIDANLSGAQQVGGAGLENSVQGFTSPEVAGAEPLQLGGPDMSQAVVPQPSPIAADKILLPQTATPAPGLEGAGQRFANAGAGVDRLTSSGGIDALRTQMASGTGINAPSMNQALGFGAAGMLGSGMFDQKNPAVGAKQHPGYIRPFNYDPFGQRYTAQTPVKADEWGSRSFNAADGGIVALAHGGAVQHYVDGGLTADQQAAAQSWVAANPNATREEALSVAAASGYTPEQANLAWSQYGPTTAAAPAAAPASSAAPAAAPAAVSATPAYTYYTDEQADSFFKAHPNIDIAAATKQVNADPAAVNRYIANLSLPYKDPTITQRGSGTLGVIQDALSKGIDANEFVTAMQGVNPDWGKDYWGKDTVSRAYDVADKFMDFSTTGKVNSSQAKELALFMDTNDLSIKDISLVTGMTESEVNALYTAGKSAAGGGSTTGGGRTTDTYTGGVTTTPKTYAPEGTTNPYGNYINPGDITVNADKSRTVQPNIPGRPYGGFTGAGQVRDAYTAGGGSLGYAPYAPKTAAEHNAMFNTMTGGSKSAYDYLMGKAPYSATPYTETGEIMKPYAESVLGVPADNTRFAQRFNPTTRKYEANPDYKPFVFNQDTGQTTRGMNQAELKEFVADPNNLKVPAVEAGTGFLGNLVQQLKDGLLDRPVWMAQNNISYEQLAASLGISVAEAKKRYPVNKASEIPAGSTGSTSTYDGGGGDSGDGASAGPGDGAGNSAGDAGGPGADGGVGGDGSSGGGDGGSASASRGGYIDRNRVKHASFGGIMALAGGGLGSFGGYASGGQADYNLGGYSDGGRLLRGPGDGVSDSIPASIGNKQPARLADGEFVVPARIVSELGNGSTEAGARKLYQMMDRVQKARGKTTGKGKVAANSRADKYLPV